MRGAEQSMPLVNGKKKYDLKEILELKPDIAIIYGGRNIGKTFQVKVCKFLTDVWEDRENGKFAYIRRWYDDLKDEFAGRYFEDTAVKLFIKKLTRGECDCIIYFRKKFYFGKTDKESGKRIKVGEHIGYAFALSKSENYKSLNFEDCKNGIFEEFIAENIYLPNEPQKLMSIYSTIKRDRTDFILFMVANALSPVCPYFDAWKLYHIKNQKQGTIETYDSFFGEYDENGLPKTKKICVQYCSEMDVAESAIEKIKSIGIKSMDVTGAWHTSGYPLLDQTIGDNAKAMHMVLFEFDGFRFRMKLLHYNGGNVWYVKGIGEKEYNIDKTIKRKVGNHFSFDDYWTFKFTPITEKEKYAFNLINTGSIVFNNNYTGENFYTCLRQLNKLENVKE